jgi:hypothetical protein
MFAEDKKDRCKVKVDLLCKKSICSVYHLKDRQVRLHTHFYDEGDKTIRVCVRERHSKKEKERVKE